MEQAATTSTRIPANTADLPPSTPAPAHLPAPRILTIINSFAPGGVERVALRLNATWQRMGVTALVLVGRSPPTGGGVVNDVQFRLIAPESWLSRHGQPIWMLRHLPAIIRQDRPDILFCPGNTYSLIAILLKLIMGRDCPLIIAKISNDLHRRDMNPAMRFLYYRWLWLHGRLIDHFVAIAPALVDEIAQRMQVGFARISVINDPVLSAQDIVDYSSHLPRPVQPGRRFIAVGRFVAQKNFPLLLAAFARIAQPDDRLTILGDGPDRGLLERLLVNLGIAGQVTLPGHVVDVRPWLADADIFCMSSNFDGVPAVVVEAIAAGLTIIATDCSAAMADLTGRGRFGTLVRVGDGPALAKAMDGAACGHGCTAEALEHVSRFTLEAGADAYLALGRSLMAQRQDDGLTIA